MTLPSWGTLGAQCNTRWHLQEEQDLGWRHGVRSKFPSTWQSDMHFLCIFLYIHSLFKINHHSTPTVPSGDHSGHTYPGTHLHQRQDHKEHGSIQKEQYQRSETPLKTLMPKRSAFMYFWWLEVRQRHGGWGNQTENRRRWRVGRGVGREVGADEKEEEDKEVGVSGSKNC